LIIEKVENPPKVLLVFGARARSKMPRDHLRPLLLLKKIRKLLFALRPRVSPRGANLCPRRRCCVSSPLQRLVILPLHGKMEDNLKIYTFLSRLLRARASGKYKDCQKRKKMMDICFEK